MRIGKTFPVALTAGALIRMLSGSSGAAELAASSTVTLPGGAAGIDTPERIAGGIKAALAKVNVR